jgi:hypothetical protein
MIGRNAAAIGRLIQSQAPYRLATRQCRELRIAQGSGPIVVESGDCRKPWSGDLCWVI